MMKNDYQNGCATTPPGDAGVVESKTGLVAKIGKATSHKTVGAVSPPLQGISYQAWTSGGDTDPQITVPLSVQ